MKISTGLIAIAVAAFIILSLAIAALLLLGKDAATYVGLIGGLLGSVVSAIVLLYGMHQQNSEIATVKNNTNGTLTALRGAIETKDSQISTALSLLNPADAAKVLAVGAGVTTLTPAAALAPTIAVAGPGTFANPVTPAATGTVTAADIPAGTPGPGLD